MTKLHTSIRKCSIKNSIFDVTKLLLSLIKRYKVILIYNSARNSHKFKETRTTSASVRYPTNFLNAPQNAGAYLSKETKRRRSWRQGGT